MKKFVLVGILALVLLAGCISMPSQSGQPGGGGNQAAATGTTGSGAQQTTETGGQPATTTEGGAGGAVSEQIGNLGEALAQSVPMECTATITDQGVTTTTHYWVKSGNMRAETQTNGQTMVAIVKNKKVYLSASAMGTMPEGVKCDWIEFEQQPSKSEPESYSTAVEDYRNPENVKVECHPSVFGDEKFATLGKICTMNDLIPPVEELPPGFEACEGLSGQALINCIQQIQQAQTG